MIQIVKIGGNVIDNPEALDSFLKKFAAISGNKILVHGGGKEATRLSKAMGIETKMVEGRRVTDRDTLDIVTMVYAGLINKRIVAALQNIGCNAIGLTGADGNALLAKRRSPYPLDFGYVGDLSPESLNVSFIRQLLEDGITPVFCAICHDDEGNLLNCNADSIASAVAAGCSNISSTLLTYCFEMPGVLRDVSDPTSVIPVVTPESFTEMKNEGIIAKGMIPKLENAIRALREGVGEVRICSADAILEGGGTIISVK